LSGGKKERERERERGRERWQTVFVLDLKRSNKDRARESDVSERHLQQQSQ
jgi:hypothetical protein